MSRCKPAGVTVLSALAVGVFAAPAFAHANLVATSPTAGSVVRHLPPTIRLRFGGRLAGVGTVKVLDSAGRDHGAAVRVDPRSAAQVLIGTRRDEGGPYVVRWRVSSADGHVIKGVLRFTVRP